MMRSMKCLAPLFAMLVLTACATTPTAKFYTLNAQMTEPAGVIGDLAFAVGPVDLPRYLDRPQIVTRSGDSRLVLEEFHRWGGSLDEEITRVLAGRIGSRLQTRRVYSYPSRLAADLDYRVALELRTFDGVLGGELRLNVAWSLIADRNGEVVTTRQSDYRVVAADAGYEAYVAAMSELLAELGDDLADALASLPANTQQ